MFFYSIFDSILTHHLLITRTEYFLDSFTFFLTCPFLIVRQVGAALQDLMAAKDEPIHDIRFVVAVTHRDGRYLWSRSLLFLRFIHAFLLHDDRFLLRHLFTPSFLLSGASLLSS